MTNHLVSDEFLAQFLHALLGSSEPVNTVIHNDDEMFISILKGRPDRDQAVCHYMRTGKQILDAITQVVKCRFGSFRCVTSFLDFACGYGRFTRFLVNQLPAERVWASDISAAAVRFQKEQFHVHGVVSTVQPNSVKFERRFNCIFVMSLFTHLPETTFVPWLKKLYSLMEKDGMLVFTVHDGSLNPHRVLPESGFWFEEESEIDTISKQDYGSNAVSTAFVLAAIDRATEGKGSYLRIPRAVNRFQDMYILVSGSASEFIDFKYSWGPVGHIDVCKIVASNLLHLEGWAAGDFMSDGQIKDIQILIDGEVMHRCLPFASRPDVLAAFNGDPRFSASGLSCCCPIPEHASGSSTVSVKAISDSGLVSVLYHNRIGTVGTIPSGAQ